MAHMNINRAYSGNVASFIDVDKEIATYPLQSGMFSLCSAKWNDDSQTFSQASEKDIVICCSKRCMNPRKICSEYCQNEQDRFKCLESCSDSALDCVRTCRNVSDMWKDTGTFAVCLAKYGCLGADGRPLPECVAQNKEEALACCKDNCVSTADRDCHDVCQALYTFSTAPWELDPSLVPSVPAQFEIPRIATETMDSIKYILIGVGIAIAIIIIILKLNYKKKK